MGRWRRYCTLLPEIIGKFHVKNNLRTLLEIARILYWGERSEFLSANSGHQGVLLSLSNSSILELQGPLTWEGLLPPQQK